MEEIKPQSSTAQEMPCGGCGASLKFAPGSSHLKCEYCGAKNEIKIAPVTISEQDYKTFLSQVSSDTSMLEQVHTVDCSGCGASTTLKPNIVSDKCAFCGKVLVVENSSTKSQIKPESLLPFKVDLKAAYEGFKKWVKGLWFAPNDLIKYIHSTDKIKGIYIPYWTYDCYTESDYSGERGIKRQETEYYTETVNGREVSRTRTVTVTDWYPASGTVFCNFDDVLINASKSLPREYAEKLEPWDLQELVPFAEQYLAGFQAETYQVGLEEGFELAKDKMEDPIRSRIRQDIGGDDQRIHSVATDYQKIKFKHTLLPIWISAYRYNGKVYRFLINGRTGEVQGERPYSWIKITLAILGGLALIGILFMIFGG